MQSSVDHFSVVRHPTSHTLYFLHPEDDNEPYFLNVILGTDEGEFTPEILQTLGELINETSSCALPISVQQHPEFYIEIPIWYMIDVKHIVHKLPQPVYHEINV